MNRTWGHNRPKPDQKTKVKVVIDLWLSQGLRIKKEKNATALTWNVEWEYAKVYIQTEKRWDNMIVWWTLLNVYSKSENYKKLRCDSKNYVIKV